MKSSRYPFAVLAVFVLLLPAAAHAGDVQGALAYVPADSMAVVGADVDRLRSSDLYAPLFQAIVQEARAQQELAKFKAQTGVDVQRDIHAFVAAFSQDMPKDDDQFLLVIEAKVSEKRFIAFAQKEGGKLKRKNSPYGPYWDIDDGDGALAFRGKYVLLGGHKTFMKGLAASRGRSAKTQGRLATRLGRVSGNDAFVVADLPPKVRQRMRGNLPNNMDVQGLAVGLDARNGLQLHGRVTLNTPKAAQQASTFIQAGLDELRRDPSLKKMGLDGYLARLSVHPVGRDLEASLVLTKVQTQKLAGLIPML